MIFFILKGLYTDENVTEELVYLHYDQPSDSCHWSKNYRETTVKRFNTLDEVTAFLQTDEFTIVTNDGTDILLPDLLQYIVEGSLGVDEMRYFEPAAFTPNLDSVYQEYHERKDLFDSVNEQLGTI